MKLFVLLLVLSLLGCAAQTRWVNADNQANFQRDAYECERDARCATGTPGSGYVTDSNPWSGVKARGQEMTDLGMRMDILQGMFDRCMSSKGWYRSPAY